MEYKYYAPSIEDIRVGYECEINSDAARGKDDEDWSQFVVGIHDNIMNISEVIRTPYLTKEQIEGEGWKFWINHTYPNRLAFEKGNYFLLLHTNNEVPFIEMILRDPIKFEKVHNPERFYLMIDCPSINEFRYICKLLKI